MSLKRMREMGILGINRRNAAYTLANNKRSLYPMVDDKLQTKRLCEGAGIPVPELLAVAREHSEVRRLAEKVREFPAFVIKPARGSMGNGILVLEWRKDQLFRGNREYAIEDLVYHSAGIVSGLYSLAGHSDVALVEERLTIDPAFDALVADGVPDLRVIIYRGVPVMAMMRLPTLDSDGRANLHQGAVGAGVSLTEGTLTGAIMQGQPILNSPDTDVPVAGFHIPHFDDIVRCAVEATDQTGLGYVGADVVVDAKKGPVILELNARPGLAIQLANRAGLRPRLDHVDAWYAELGESDPDAAARIAFGRDFETQVAA